MILETKDSSEIIQFYAAIATQSAAMLCAAQSGDWDSLCQAEEHCSVLIHELQILKETQAAQLNEEERIKHINYLKKILADDAAIRDITEPRLRQLEEFLRASTNTQKLSNSYGSN